MLTYTVTEAKAKFAEVIAKAAAGEEIIITRMGREAAKIVPSKTKRASLPKRTGFLSGHYRMADDFDEWPEDVARAFGMVD